MDLVITSGGLGPTADDLTAEVVADFAGLSLAVDPALEERIYAIVERLRSRWRDVSEEGLRAGSRKQALVPRGSGGARAGRHRSGPDRAGRGRAAGGRAARGRRRELQPMWADGRAVAACCRRCSPGSLTQRIMRMTGVPESELARTLRGLDLGGLEVTTCLRRGELEIATVFPAADSSLYSAFEAALLSRHGAHVFARDGETIDEIVAGLLLGPPLRTIAVAESCTGGLMAARLTDRAGSSAYALGGVVAYSNAAKVDAGGRGRGVDRAARRGVAAGGRGPGRGGRCPVRRGHRRSASPASPARTAALRPSRSARSASASRGPAARWPSAPCTCRATAPSVRERTTTVVMHMLRRLLAP